MLGDKEITCKYLAYRFHDRFIRLPLVKIYLKGKQEVETIGLIDSGATMSFLPYEIADLIGIIPTDKNKIKKGAATAAAGNFETHIVCLPILRLIKGAHSFEEFRGIHIHIPSSEDIPIPYAILGRDHVFNRFDIIFHENRQKVTFKRTKTSG